MIRPQHAFDNYLDPIRKFILEGHQTSKQIAFLLYDRNLIERALNLPFPCHGVLLFGSHKHKKIGSIITIFGLFNYFVLLNKNAYYLIKDWDNYVYINPIKKEVRYPILRSYPSMPNLIKAIKNSLNDRDVFKKATNHAREKLNMALEELNILKK